VKPEALPKLSIFTRIEASILNWLSLVEMAATERREMPAPAKAGADLAALEALVEQRRASR
jgi:hypothetical protein